MSHATTFGGGAGLFRAIIWKRRYNEVNGTPPEDMNAVLVFRAEAIWLAMNDDIWKTSNVGEAQGFKGKQPGRFRVANPVAVNKVDKLPTDEAAQRKAMTFLLPGVVMQPSGVFATLRAQEAGCRYILAS